ncbi:MAG: outer membrane protein assembly factor BamD [Flavobacterium sp. BFFFF2]|nr:MAG: outer membrane protein assembly factor BamD [Flavobacterium sp. BFFFF2]
MKGLTIKITSLFLLLITLNSCSSFQRALKSEDMEVKLAEATKQFNKKKYQKVIRLSEQMVSNYKGRPEGEDMFYMFANSYYKTEQFYLANYQFESFVSNYPASKNVEECAFLGAKSYTKLSPRYSLDQEDTLKAIDRLQLFIDTYPNSSYMTEANQLMTVLREKLEKKYFEIAKQYFQISDYASAMVNLDNFINDFPGTRYKEEALFIRLKAAYFYAINSVQNKMGDRLKNAKVAYNTLIKFNANTTYKSKADEMLVRIETDLKPFLNK